MKYIHLKVIALNIFMLLAVTFTMRATTNMLMTIIPVFTKYVINADVLDVGLTATLAGIGALISNIFVNGKIRIDRTPVTIFSFLLLMTISIFFLIFSSNIYEVLVLSLASGLSMGVVQTLLMTLITALAPRELRDRYIAMFTASLSLSLIAGTLAQGLIVKYINVRTAFIIFFFVSLLSTLIMLISSRRIKINPGKSKKIKFSDVLSKSSTALKNPKVQFALSGNISYAFPFVLILTYGSIFGNEYDNINPSSFFYILAAFFFVSFLTRLYMSTHSIKRKELLMYFSFVLGLAGYIIIGISSYYIIFLIGLIILGIPHGSIYPISSYYLSNSVETEDLNIVYSMFSFIMNIIAFIIPFVYGLISKLYDLRIASLSLSIPMALVIIYSVISNIKGNRSLKRNESLN
ncbi:MFS transporter [Picrophilus oshimae]|uniref:Predicted arabinose efflux permease, MFS family n=1 Tax=Picrophilus torridus (strain ATCC 700027 / DSM 9790 / JCM 10055 / NBRC 100828 / KAW 2/3) TaxID=1122961 RepID=Q6L2S9_PICTO|nr:MFS transporter [Picrophilus oshimae]AAT42723.1 transporter [Picrophilus oshimae DSM 9789]SMD31511.1 Predicted arabinose efflux permease, MFS family [Picrophilus oshimae DSM 9789]